MLNPQYELSQARNHMWHELIQDYDLMSKNERKRSKMHFAVANGNCKPGQISTSTANTLVPVPKTFPGFGSGTVGTLWTQEYTLYDVLETALNPRAIGVKPKKEETMDANYNTELRIRTIYDQKRRELNKFFHIDDDQTPQSPQEMVQRIQDGKFEFTKQAIEFAETYGDRGDYTYEDEFGGSFYGIVWRDPELKADNASYKAAEKKLDAAHQRVKDAYDLLPSEKVFDMIQEFSAQDFRPSAA